MIADVNELKKAVERNIFSLFKVFAESPGLFWSEGDVESYLYSLLINDPTFKKCLPSFQRKGFNKESKTTLVHTQAQIYPKRLGKKIADIVIVIPTEKIEHKNTESVFGIEIKFNRSRPAGKEKSGIINDIRKVQDNKKGYILWLNWDRPISKSHKDIAQEKCNNWGNVKFYYIDMFSGTKDTNAPI